MTGVIDPDEPRADGGTDITLLARILYRYGVPAFIALMLTYVMVHNLTVNVDAMRAEHQGMLFYLRQICINSATNATQLASCAGDQPAR